jgi:predicted dehydrogenase
VARRLQCGERMRDEKVRFAVIGLGHIAQVAVLPAFAHARERCELVALVSSDEEKIAELSERYDVDHGGPYQELEAIFEAAGVNAAYIALPNTEHRRFTERCARAGVHVLCEKPMAMSVEDCVAMIDVCDENDVKLMIAYRLHFEPATLHAIEIAKSGRLGALRSYSSSFGHTIKPGGIRATPELGGGALFDMGIYCVNAARNLFREEPEEVFGVQTFDPRFSGVDATTSALLRFPSGRSGQFTASQHSADVSEYRIVGTKGDLRVDPGYEYVGSLVHHLTIDGKTTKKEFPKLDQFAPELLYFAECVVTGKDPEPSGEEGLADVRVLQAIAESASSSRPIQLEPFTRSDRPGRELETRKPPVEKPETVNAPSPSK